MSGSWVAGWAVADIVSAAEFKKSLGSVGDTTLGGSAASISFTSLPTTYGALRVVLQIRNDQAASGLAKLQFNGDTAANYKWIGGLLTGAATPTSGASYIDLLNGNPVSGTGAPAGCFSEVQIWIPNYGSASLQKNVMYLWTNWTSATQVSGGTGWGFWGSTAAINQLTFSLTVGSYIAGCRASAYVMGV
jgi:hypothetical protein